MTESANKQGFTVQLINCPLVKFCPFLNGVRIIYGHQTYSIDAEDKTQKNMQDSSCNLSEPFHHLWGISSTFVWRDKSIRIQSDAIRFHWTLLKPACMTNLQCLGEVLRQHQLNRDSFRISSFSPINLNSLILNLTALWIILLPCEIIQKYTSSTTIHFIIFQMTRPCIPNKGSASSECAVICHMDIYICLKLVCVPILAAFSPLFLYSNGFVRNSSL